MVRTAEPPIAKQRVHVLVSGDEPVVGGFVVKDRSPLAELGVDGVGGRDEGRVRRIKPELARGDALSEHCLVMVRLPRDPIEGVPARIPTEPPEAVKA